MQYDTKGVLHTLWSRYVIGKYAYKGATEVCFPKSIMAEDLTYPV